jgi:hypothetical protein
MSQGDAFDRALMGFCKTLVTCASNDFNFTVVTDYFIVELNQPIDAIARARTPHGYPRGPYQQHPTRTPFRRSLTSLVPSWRSSSVSLSCPQIPPLDFGGNIVWHEVPFISVIPSSPSSERGSLRSSRASTASRIRVSYQSSHSSLQRTSSVSADNSSARSFRSERTSFTVPTSFISELPDHRIPGIPTQLLERQAALHSSALDIFAASGTSPLDIALTTRMSGYIWKSGVQPRVIANATLEGLIHYLLLKSAGEKSGLFL